MPADVLELAKVKSGYKLAKAQYEASLYDVEQATLTAPFDGVVANLFDKNITYPRTINRFVGSSVHRPWKWISPYWKTNCL